MNINMSSHKHPGDNRLRETLLLAKDTLEIVFPSIHSRMQTLQASFEPTAAEHWSVLARAVALTIDRIQNALASKSA